MTIDWIDTQVDMVPPTDPDGAGPTVVLRSWLVVADRLPLNRTLPMLTGLYGYPWRTGRLDARCTAANRFDHEFTLPPRIERHHSTVPEPSCSCGIYANSDETPEPVRLRSPVGVPVVTGFVELSGRIVTESTTYRAQRASIVGPLTLHPGRPPLRAVLLHRSIRPQRVATVGADFQVRWADRPTGAEWVDWAMGTSRSLAARYEVEVLASRP